MNQIEMFVPIIESLKEQFLIIEQQRNDLKCCGNCENAHVVNIDTYCEIRGEQINSHKVCELWYPDGLTKEGRRR